MDDTLYPLSIGINLACRKNIQGKETNISRCLSFLMIINGHITEFCVSLFSLFAEFMLNQLGIEESEVPKLCLDLYKEYGTTMAGLKVSYFKILHLKHSL